MGYFAGKVAEKVPKACFVGPTVQNDIKRYSVYNDLELEAANVWLLCSIDHLNDTPILEIAVDPFSMD